MWECADSGSGQDILLLLRSGGGRKGRMDEMETVVMLKNGEEK